MRMLEKKRSTAMLLRRIDLRLPAAGEEQERYGTSNRRQIQYMQ